MAFEHACYTVFTEPSWRPTGVFAKLATMAATSHSPQRLFHHAPWSALLAACMIGCAAQSAHATPETWRFDPVHSQIWFSAGHQHFSRPLGRLRIKDGWFQFDPAHWDASRVDVLIDMNSLDLGDTKWNSAVKSSQFLDTERWPTARFVSRSVDKTDATHGVIHGDLSLHGETLPVDVAFTLNRIATDPYAFKRKAGFSASATLQRSAFGMKRYAEVVSEDITLRIEIEGVHAADPPPSPASAQP